MSPRFYCVVRIDQILSVAEELGSETTGREGKQKQGCVEICRWRLKRKGTQALNCLRFKKGFSPIRKNSVGFVEILHTPKKFEI